MSQTEERLVIPPDALAVETLEAVIEEFISREGTDYGLQEVPLSVQKQRAMEAIQRGEVLVIFDAKLESVQLISSEDFNHAI